MTALIYCLLGIAAGSDIPTQLQMVIAQRQFDNCRIVAEITDFERDGQTTLITCQYGRESMLQVQRPWEDSNIGKMKLTQRHLVFNGKEWIGPTEPDLLQAACQDLGDRTVGQVERSWQWDLRGLGLSQKQASGPVQAFSDPTIVEWKSRSNGDTITWIGVKDERREKHWKLKQVGSSFDVVEYAYHTGEAVSWRVVSRDFLTHNGIRFPRTVLVYYAGFRSGSSPRYSYEVKQARFNDPALPDLTPESILIDAGVNITHRDAHGNAYPGVKIWNHEANELMAFKDYNALVLAGELRPGAHSLRAIKALERKHKEKHEVYGAPLATYPRRYAEQNPGDWREWLNRWLQAHNCTSDQRVKAISILGDHEKAAEDYIAINSAKYAAIDKLRDQANQHRNSREKQQEWLTARYEVNAPVIAEFIKMRMKLEKILDPHQVLPTDTRAKEAKTTTMGRRSISIALSPFTPKPSKKPSGAGCKLFRPPILTSCRCFDTS